MRTKDDSTNVLAVKFLGIALILIIIGILLLGFASIGYNTYISIDKEKIEVRAENSNSIK